MSKTKLNFESLGNDLDTLAQRATNQNDKEYSESVQLIQGKGACKSSIAKRPRKKFITQKLVLALIDVAKKNGDIEWEKRYWNAWHCQNVITTHNGRGYGHYCDNRFCLVCVAIRKAKMINKYKPEIMSWSNPHFLTLTVKAQPNSNLQKWMDGMIEAMTKIRKRCQKRYERETGPKLKLIKSLECNFNPQKQTYNPHFHILTESKEIAEVIKSEWCKLWTPTFALPYLQKIRKVKDTEKDLIETIKYGAKLFTDPTMKKGKSKKKDHIIYAAGLHEIYKAMNGRHLFGSMGFKLSKETKTSTTSKLVIDFKEWYFDTHTAMYVDTQTGQVMKDFVPDEELESILNRINIEHS